MSDRDPLLQWCDVFREPREHPGRREVRDAIVTSHLPLVRKLAWRYRDRGEPMADLVQVGNVALVKAVERFDPTIGTPFTSYAAPTIVGEIKRHFRDLAWLINVPRATHELSALVQGAYRELEQRLGHQPAPPVIAAHLGIGVDQVVVALDAALARNVLPLDSLEIKDARADEWLTRVEDQVTVRAMLATLPAEERAVVVLRFLRGWSQVEVASRLGCSQMQVSRIQERALLGLRLQSSRDSRCERDDDADHSGDQ